MPTRFPDNSRALPGQLPGLARAIPELYPDDSRVLPGRFLGFTRTIPKAIPGGFPGRAQTILEI